MILDVRVCSLGDDEMRSKWRKPHDNAFETIVERVEGRENG